MRKYKTYDYIIVGAGSAGCVLANRLGAKQENRILVLEAGGKDHSYKWKIHMPASLGFAFNDEKLNWNYCTDAEPYMENRRMRCPRGRVVGGSSSINGMVYVRGHAFDYDHWVQKGLTGWSYAELLPYFRRAECRDLGPNDYHGGDGPLHVTRSDSIHPLTQAWLEAGCQAGYPETSDFNGIQQEGLGLMDQTTYNGRRWSAAKAYLRPVMRAKNVNLVTRALTLRILFEGTRAVGVEFFRDGSVTRARAVREVILSGGVINSPQLLMLSGIGDADELSKHNIPIIRNLPGVGQNLQDHLEADVRHVCLQPITLYRVVKSRLLQLLIGMQWALLGKGIGASNQFEAGAFIRSRTGIKHPDLQYHFMNIAGTYSGGLTHVGHSFQAHVGVLRPKSRGHVKLKSQDPRASPQILFNYMQDDDDCQVMRTGIPLAREIFAQKAFDPYRGVELAPGPEIKTDAEIDRYVRRTAESGYHPACTCKMGTTDDPMAVVDAEARVNGTEALRVIDASIMPSVVSGNLNAPIIAIAEKLSDTILGEAQLPPSDSKVYIAPSFRTAQR